MHIQLTRPLAFFDLETTGINISHDRIIEIGIVKIMPDGEIVKKRKLINPEMTISQETIDIHGITNEMVKDAPTFKEAANEIKQFLDDADLGGFNSNKFDIPLLVEEFLRVGIDFNMKDRKMIDAQKIFHKKEPRNLAAAYQFYCDKELLNAHSALADIEATWEILDAQIARYSDIGNTVDSIIKFTGEDDLVDFSKRMIKVKGVPVFNFGKYKGQAVVDVLRREPQYYDWIMKSDFALDTKQKLSEIFNDAFLRK